MRATPPGLEGRAALPTRLVARVAGMSDPGITRDHNEDGCLMWKLGRRVRVAEGEWASVDLLECGLFLLVSDGVGGAIAGEIASGLVVDTFAAWAWGNSNAGAPRVDLWLTQGILEANQRLLEEIASDPGLKGMGATATAAVVLEDYMFLAQVGDSRAYVLRDGAIRQVTRDQSVVQQLIERGELTKEAARYDDRKNIILQALGSDPPPTPALLTVEVKKGDRIVLCSDGLSDMVEDIDIGRVIDTSENPAEQCAALIRAANGRGGLDNITAVVAHIE